MILSRINSLAEFTAEFDRFRAGAWSASATTSMYQATLAGRACHPDGLPGPFRGRLPSGLERTHTLAPAWGWAWYLELAALREKYQGEG
jgi:hypothetical protein